MTRMNIAQWTLLIGLITGVLGMITAYFNVQDKVRQANLQASALAEKQADFDRAQEAYKKQREADIEANKKMLEAQMQAQQHAAICDKHHSTVSAIEERFSSLMSEHGPLMNSIKSCLNQSTDDDRKGCTLLLCGASAVFYNVNCVEIAANADSINKDYSREVQAARSDLCEIGSSPIQTFFNN